MIIKQIIDENEKKAIAREVLEALPEWFGIREAREDYIANCAGRLFFAAFNDSEAIGFICLRESGRDTAEIYVMGVLKQYHRQGVGRRLFEAAKTAAAENGYSFLQVKTVKMGIYAEYDATNRFYLSLGFKDFEVLPTLRDERNPCQIYVMSLR